MTWQIRRASPADAAALALVGAATFLETFAGLLDGRAIVDHCARHHAPDAYAAYLADPACSLDIAEAKTGAAPVGYTLLTPAELPGGDARTDLELKRIYALSRFHGTDLGAALMQRAIDHASAAGFGRLLLGAYAGNARALAFYAKHGFAEIATRRFAVGDQLYCDIVLAKPLPTSG